jgi:hypothetical protein
MMPVSFYFYTSVTRCSDLWVRPFKVGVVPRDRWRTGDFVAAEVVGEPNSLYRCETKTGRIAELLAGDRIIGALGERAATLEGVGSWRAVGEEGELEVLTGAGLLGKATSTSLLLPSFMRLRYLGHAQRDGTALNMADFVAPVAVRGAAVPVILVIGTSMSAGKTSSGRILIRELRGLGLRVAAAKVTGAARYRDILSFRDAGATAVFDFVDEGLPSTICSGEIYAAALDRLLARIAASEPDVVVIESGASPLEPYNGTLALARILPETRMTLLCASDPYAVVGVQIAFGLKPDLVAGPAANTTAAIALVERLAGIPALNLMDSAARPALRAMLMDRLGIREG